MKILVPWILALVSILPVSTVNADTVEQTPQKEMVRTEHQYEVLDKEHIKEEYRAHEHGIAALVVVISPTVFEVALESPAFNIFGFEHEAKTEEQKKVVAEKTKLLSDVDKLFSIATAAGCEFGEVELDSDVMSEEANDSIEGIIEKKVSTHNDVDVSWVFNCENTKAIKTIGVKLFSAFPKGFHVINVEWLTAEKASSVTLKQDGEVVLE